MTSLSCDMERGCSAPVAMIDKKGYVYCADHGLMRRGTQPCRQLQPWELRRLEGGRPLSRY